MKYGLFCLLVAAGLAGCNYRIERNKLNQGQMASFASVQRYILEPKCVGCHNGPNSPKGVDLSSYGTIMASNTIVPYHCTSSPIWDSLTSGRMPKGQSPLSAAEMALIREWIDTGAKKEGGTQPPPPPPTPVLEPKYASLNEIIFKPRCAVCHNGKHPKTKLDLRTYESLFGFTGDILKAIEPGDPDTSSLYLAVSQKDMPPSGPPLSADEVKAIETWIKAGAKKGESL